MQSPLSFIPTSGFETSHTIHSYPRSIQVFGDIENTSSLSNPNISDLPFHTLDKNSRPPTPEHYNYPLFLDNQIVYHPRQDQRYRILPVNRITNSHQYSQVTRQRELNRLTHSNLELRFEVSVKFSGLDPHPIPASTEIKYRTIPNPFVVTSVQFTALDDPPFNHNWGHITFYNYISGLKYKTTF